MSASDIRDVLEISEIRKPISKKIKADAAGKRLDGLQRELYSLLGNNTPPVAVADNRFRNKPNWRQKVVPWKWSEFTNRARKEADDNKLVLHHWVRADHTDSQSNYPFAAYDTKISVPVFTKSDYDESFSNKDWSFDETDYLFNLCRDYDLRWLVIQDRYDYKKTNEDVEMKNGDESQTGNGISDTKSRNVEDLKLRYYSVCREIYKLREKRGETLSPAEEELVNQMVYSKENELKRKAHLERLLGRSPAEIAEEEALVIESRKLEAAAERMLMERQEILRLLDAPQPTGDISKFETSQGLAQLTTTLLTSDKVKKKKDSATPSSIGTPIEATPTGSSRSIAPRSNTSPVPSKSVAAPNRKPTVLSGAAAVQALVQRKLSAKEEAAFGLSYHDKLSPGVYLRSTKITTYKPALQSKVNAIFQQLELPVRPVMPTAKVCAKMESLLQSITVLVQAKKQLDELETELEIKQTETTE